MPASNGAWQTIRRLLVRIGSVSAAAGTEGSAGKLSSTCAAIRRMCGCYSRRKQQMREAILNEQRYRRDALRRMRRAKRRSLVLLVKLLNAEQRREFRKSGCFQVIGGSTGDRYRIRVDVIANIDVMRDDSTVKYRLCVRPSGDIPVYDVMAAQLLHLQDAASEQQFLRHANILSTLPEDRVYFRSIWLA